MYLGMVYYKPTLINNYVNLLYMLEVFKTLNTNKYFSENFKDVTISNQQETKSLKQIKLGSSETIQEESLFFNLIKERLRYSPINSKNIYLYLKSLKAFSFYKLINIKLNNLYNLSINVRHYNTKNNVQINNINPYWITGFVDAEGCFSVIIEIKDKTKWKVTTSFEINLHIKDVDILYKIQSFFGVGAIYLRTYKNIAVYKVTKIKYLKDIIIPHFLKYSLISQKYIDFTLWSKVVDLILNKEHLTHKGFITILSYYASRGVSKKVFKFYPKAFDRLSVNLPTNLNPYWVSGFISGDGCFSIIIRESKSYKLKKQVVCSFHVTQHIKDIKLINLLSKFFNCGTVYLRSNSSERCDFVVQDINSILSKIIPHFDNYPILNLKYEDYICFKKALKIIQLKQHLTLEGLNKIKNFNLEMNSNRLK